MKWEMDIAGYLLFAGYRNDSIHFFPRDIKGKTLTGVIYISSNATTLPLGSQYSTKNFALSTQEDVKRGLNRREYNADLKSGGLVIMGCKSPDGVIMKRYAITSAFITQYVSFDTSAIIYSDACSSMDFLATVPFYQACLDKGAAAYFGWTHPVSNQIATRASRSFFAYATGSAYGHALHQNPTQRPFDEQSIFNELTADGLLHDAFDNDPVNKSLYPTGSDLVLRLPSLKRYDRWSFTPSIEHLEVAAIGSGDTQIVIIVGTFGTDSVSGHVYINDFVSGNPELKRIVWTPTYITCFLPVTGQGSSGIISVSVGNIYSNSVPLTLWTGTFSWTGVIPSGDFRGLQYTINWTGTIRGDVHPYRSNAGSDAQTPCHLLITPDHHCTYSISTDASADSGTTYSGSGELNWLTDTNRGPFSSNFTYSVSDQYSTAHLDTFFFPFIAAAQIPSTRHFASTGFTGTSVVVYRIQASLGLIQPKYIFGAGSTTFGGRGTSMEYTHADIPAGLAYPWHCTNRKSGRALTKFVIDQPLPFSPYFCISNFNLIPEDKTMRKHF